MIAFWSAGACIRGVGRDLLQSFETPVPQMMEALSGVGIHCVDANTDTIMFIEKYLGGSTRASAAIDSMAVFVPRTHLSHSTPNDLPHHLHSAAYGGNMYHACDLWRELVEAGGDFSRIENLGSHRVYEQTGEMMQLSGANAGVVVPEVRVVTEGPNDFKYRTKAQGHPPAAVLAASTLARDQPVEVDLRDELYQHLDDYELAELFITKKAPGKRSKLPQRVMTSGHHGSYGTYDRARLLLKLKEACIVPDPPSGDAA